MQNRTRRKIIGKHSLGSSRALTSSRRARDPLQLQIMDLPQRQRIHYSLENYCQRLSIGKGTQVPDLQCWMTNCHEAPAVLPGSPRQIIGMEELLPGKLWRTKVQQRFWVLLQPLFLFVVCFVELTELGGMGLYARGGMACHCCRGNLMLCACPWQGLQCARSSFSKVCTSESAGSLLKAG